MFHCQSCDVSFDANANANPIFFLQPVRPTILKLGLDPVDVTPVHLIVAHVSQALPSAHVSPVTTGLTLTHSIAPAAVRHFYLSFICVC